MSPREFAEGVLLGLLFSLPFIIEMLKPHM